MNTLLVTGSNGWLGSAIFNVFNLFDASYYDLIYIIPAVTIIIYKHKENISKNSEEIFRKFSTIFYLCFLFGGG